MRELNMALWILSMISVGSKIAPAMEHLFLCSTKMWENDALSQTKDYTGKDK